MTHVSLFSGIGGLDLAAEWAGFETVLQVEQDSYALRVLEKHWPDVPRITDVREVQADERWIEPTVVSGGFPCQPFSSAGKRRGTEDDRYLWPELLRIVEELRPAFVVGENVSGLLSIDGGLEIDRMLAAMEARDYTPWILHYPAAGVGAPHRRDRVFIVANAKRERVRDKSEFVAGGISTTVAKYDGTERAVADTSSSRITNICKRSRNTETTSCKEKSEFARGYKNSGTESREFEYWAAEPDVGRVANGIPRRMDRLRALGNAVVPQQAYPIFAAIAEVEGSTVHKRIQGVV